MPRKNYRMHGKWATPDLASIDRPQTWLRSEAMLGSDEQAADSEAATAGS
jgi:hypothetical protein